MEYIERENEFEEEVSDEDLRQSHLPEDERKKIKFAKTNIDIETINPFHLCTHT